jgi:hypothetical protein
MKTGRVLATAAVVLAVLFVGIWRAGPSGFEPESVEVRSVVELMEPAVEKVSSGPGESAEFVVYEVEDPLVGFVGEGLNRSGGTVQEDLRIVDEVLEAWRTSFPDDGNPVGTNREITTALGGKNALRLELIPATHPAVNSKGELCDRWGSPLVFHQVSGAHMEIRSAGPDRLPYTEDDVVANPASKF